MILWVYHQVLNFTLDHAFDRDLIIRYFPHFLYFLPVSGIDLGFHLDIYRLGGVTGSHLSQVVVDAIDIDYHYRHFVGRLEELHNLIINFHFQVVLHFDSDFRPLGVPYAISSISCPF